MSRIEIDAEAIRRLARLLEETGLSEIEVGDGTGRLRVARQVVNGLPAATAVGVPVHAATPAAEDGDADQNHPGAVRSPMVGTAYVAPQPGSPPFVKAGDAVVEGQTLLIVEAMKTMNLIRAPRAGSVRRVLIADATPIEYGQVLMILE